jgi:hypothetical protein
MGVIYHCDACHLRACGVSDRPHGWIKPKGWYQRWDVEADQTYDACSRLCVKRLEKEHDLSGLILPFGEIEP